MFCPTCGTQIQPEAAFCQKCGTKLSPGSAATPVQKSEPPPLPRTQPGPVTQGPVYFRKPEKKSNKAGIVLAIILGVFGFIAILGIIAAIAIPNLLNAVQRGKQKRTMADIRAIGTAVQAYYDEHNAYPDATSVQQLAGILEPKYIHTVPKVDGWDHDFRYSAWSNDPSPGFAIGSSGKDGIWEKTDLRAYTPMSGQSFDSDIVFVSGQFVQQPDMTSSVAYHSESPESSNPGPPKQFAQLNFSFLTPPKPWAEMDAKKINKSSTLAFIRMQPQVIFFLIAEKIPEGALDTSALAEISKGNLKSAASHVDFLEEGKYMLGTKNGIRFVSKANIGGNDMLYVHWVYSEGSYAYQLITAGELADQQAIKQEAEKMVRYFKLLNQNQK